MSTEPSGPTNRSSLGITVCVPSIRAATVEAAIASIRRQTWSDWELLVVMQGHDGDLRRRVAAVEREDPRIRGIWIAERGVSKARNTGVRSAQFGTIAFLDDDCEASPDWLARIHDAFGADPSVGIVAGVLEAPRRSGGRPATCPAVDQRDLVFRPSPEARTLPQGTGFASASLAVRHWVWERVVSFDEELGPGATFPSGEDLDLLTRIVDAKVPIRFSSEAVVHHTYGTRRGFRPVLRMSVDYAAGQGAVAAKLTLRGEDGASWRAAIREQCLTGPIRSLRLHAVPASLPRLVAFERAYRRCVRDFTVDAAGLLCPRDDRS